MFHFVPVELFTIECVVKAFQFQMNQTYERSKTIDVQVILF